MLPHLKIFLATALGLKNLFEFSPKVDKTLRFNSNHEFTILQMTDLHYGEDDSKDTKNQAIQQKLINYVKPDLVVLTGDMVSGYAWDGKTSNFFYNCWKKFTKCFTDNKLLYAYALGNHDHQADYDYEQIGALDKTHPYSLFEGNEVDEKDSMSNFSIEIKSSFNQEETTTNLWMFDSKDTSCHGIDKSYGCIGEK